MKYEIFISYKYTDESGAVTKDSEIAKNLYDTLTDAGYSVFFSSNTLEQIGSLRYKADIDAALDSARSQRNVTIKSRTVTLQTLG